ncbi:hypothetical protein SAMN02745166_05000 [Prosthecobacter debontii]|uniref:Uncharacterized protein n=1 Tax=Prosthecobacter debontii TaxID=48467 RepID=A0A1T4Z435_9BACT|nr:hypothetical protein [Prosthecobacter debontii]SKB08706.1 hypothetical protein SAMN02745166_05000 [Prosthecobacter debontii]
MMSSAIFSAVAAAGIANHTGLLRNMFFQNNILDAKDRASCFHVYEEGVRSVVEDSFYQELPPDRLQRIQTQIERLGFLKWSPEDQQKTLRLPPEQQPAALRALSQLLEPNKLSKVFRSCAKKWGYRRWNRPTQTEIQTQTLFSNDESEVTLQNIPAPTRLTRQGCEWHLQELTRLFETSVSTTYDRLSWAQQRRSRCERLLKSNQMTLSEKRVLRAHLKPLTEVIQKLKVTKRAWDSLVIIITKLVHDGDIHLQQLSSWGLDELIPWVEQKLQSSPWKTLSHDSASPEAERQRQKQLRDNQLEQYKNGQKVIHGWLERLPPELRRLDF